jgi:hypothetical protein
MNSSGNHGKKLFDATFTVCIRIRPMNERERSENMSICFVPTEDSRAVEELDCENGHRIKFWHYDTVYGPSTTNRGIFENVGIKICDAALDGFNAVGFLYGQTSSGNVIAELQVGCIVL